MLQVIFSIYSAAKCAFDVILSCHSIEWRDKKSTSNYHKTIKCYAYTKNHHNRFAVEISPLSRSMDFSSKVFSRWILNNDTQKTLTNFTYIVNITKAFTYDNKHLAHLIQTRGKNKDPFLFILCV